MLLHAAPDSAYVYLSWNEIPEATGYRIDWRPADNGQWRSQTFLAPAYHGSIEELANDTTYEFRVTAVVDGGEPFTSQVVHETPRVRSECTQSIDFGCTLGQFREALLTAPAALPFSCNDCKVFRPAL